MRFALSVEQRDFAASLRDLLEGAKTPQVIRAWGGGDSGPGRTLLRQLADAGVTGLAVNEELGGLGATAVDLAVAFIEVGRSGAPGPLIETAAVIPTLLQQLPDDTLAQRWLPEIAEGRAVASVALPPHVPRALDADVADVVFRVEGEQLEEVEPDLLERSVDAARRVFTVTGARTVAEGVDSAPAFDMGVLACAAQLLGAGHAMLDMTTDYAKNRVQFGRPIGQFQAVKHHLADALVGIEMATPLLYGAAIALGNNDPHASRDVSSAKIACSDAAYLAARKALQVHGAIGYTAEYDLSLWLTKVRALQAAWGTASVHRARVAESLRSVS
ncbi:acyl-CoA dehydrogenase family protein [Antrihabitans sp. YC2-6]|uniref:acyl-CoA dehydrogenase family protein n=1 Tax=Antrihabitans sp. YC2-6 TaxID=2799498 RepID=UPI0018F50A34|nr:acyl-CoA dehydrogenase family protein [Antrihabitans sp. YC2-6]MBJ8345884.1 acyl-CoA/acyl-ACP dehydrogenase [Antrihabitans sp. YC2-6]